MTPRLPDATAGTRQPSTRETMMIRAIALATVLGALIGSVAVYAISPPGWRNGIRPLFGGLERGGKTATMPEDWPICTTMTSVASDADWAQLDPDFKAGKKALGAEDWNGAIAAFELAALRDPLNADIQNYIGYAYQAATSAGAGYWPLSAGADVKSAPPQRA